LPAPEGGGDVDRQQKEANLEKTKAETKKAEMEIAGTLPPKPGAQSVSDTDVQDIISGIKSGDLPPDLSKLAGMFGGARFKLSAELSRQGIDLNKLNLDYNAMQKTVAGLNSTQQVRMRQALDSVTESIPTLRKLNSEFDRMSWKPASWAQLTAAMSGTDPTKRDLATKYVGQINLMKDELAQGFMGGGVPTDRAFKLADDILNPVYGAQQMASALDQLDINLNIRKNAIAGIEPQTLGPMSEQYQGMAGAGKKYMEENDQTRSKAPVKYKAGDIKVIKGITYKRNEEGKWLPQS
jgi:hypothetical protein